MKPTLSLRRKARGVALAGIFLLGLLMHPALVRGQGVQATVESILQSSGIRTTDCGVYIVGLKDGQVLASINADKALIPASNMKLVTTATALSVLGSDFVFRTRLWLTSEGLVIEGDGDPALGDPELLGQLNTDVEALLGMWVDAVKKLGTKEFPTLLIDDRVFDQQFVHPNWPDNQLNRWYCAQVSGINFNNNCLDVFASPTRPGDSPEIKTSPIDPPVDLINRAETSDRNAFWATRDMGTNAITLRGQVKHKLLSPINVTIHDPAMFFTRLLQDRLQDAGIRVGKIERLTDEQERPEGVLLAVVETPISTVVTRCNKNSQNLFAEALLKRIAHATTGQPGSWTTGAAAVRLFLSHWLGPDAAEVQIDDGSGMSRENRIAPRILAQLLAKMATDDEAGRIFMQSLAVGGEDGTLENRFDDVELKGTVLAKSGYISGVVALSGYVIQDDQAVAFSIILNDFKKAPYQGKQVTDRIVEAVDKYMAARRSIASGR